MDDREHDRIPYSVAIRFRTPGSFLVAYSVNLSKGGVFLETDELLPVGTELLLKFAIPDAGEFELPGVVSWRREEPDDDDGPRGLGVAFDRIEEALGSAIDALVAEFEGLTVLLFCDDEEQRSSLARAVRAIIGTADVVEAAGVSTAEALLDDAMDLCLIDADSAHGAGIEVLRAAKSKDSGVPAVVLAATTSGRMKAAELGADEVLDNPPQFTDLRKIVLRALGRPASVG